jgi:hypothetical protein
LIEIQWSKATQRLPINWAGWGITALVDEQAPSASKATKPQIEKKITSVTNREASIMAIRQKTKLTTEKIAEVDERQPVFKNFDDRTEKHPRASIGFLTSEMWLKE